MCLNSQLQLRGETLTKQLVQCSSAPREPLVVQIPLSLYTAGESSQQHQPSPWKALWEAHLHLPALICTGLVQLPPEGQICAAVPPECAASKTTA